MSGRYLSGRFRKAPARAAPGLLFTLLSLALMACTTPPPPVDASSATPPLVDASATPPLPIAALPPVDVIEAAGAVAIVERQTATTTVGYCTGVLIAPDLVATASHCAGDASPASLRIFVGGDVRTALEFVARGAIVTETGNTGSRTGPDDWLVARITPVDATPAVIAGVAEDVKVGASVAVIAARGPLHNCSVRGEPVPAVIQLNCAVEHGDSGSPVLLMTPEGPKLIGILIARTPDAAYAAAAWQFADLVDAEDQQQSPSASLGAP